MKRKFTKKNKTSAEAVKKTTSPNPQSAQVLTRKLSLLRKKQSSSGTESRSGSQRYLKPDFPKESKKINLPVWVSQVVTVTRVTTVVGLSIVCSIASLILLPRISTTAARYLALFEGRIPQTEAMELGGQVAGAEIAPKVVIKSLNLPPPDFTAQAVLAEDLETGQTLYQKNIHQHLLPASTTKLMTALVGLDYYKMVDVLTVKPESLVGGSTMGLTLGEKLTFRSLLYGMLLNSGNDAAFTIAANYPGGVEAFVGQMNAWAKNMGLTDTHFQNPAGFDDPAHYTSAYDLARIGQVVANNSTLSRVVDTRQTVVESIGDKKTHVLKNVDELLSMDGVIGIKTGYTDEAGENFVGLVDRQDKKVLTVVLDSKDRFGETEKLMDWVYQNYQWVNQ